MTMTYQNEHAEDSFLLHRGPQTLPLHCHHPAHEVVEIIDDDEHDLNGRDDDEHLQQSSIVSFDVNDILNGNMKINPIGLKETIFELEDDDEEYYDEEYEEEEEEVPPTVILASSLNSPIDDDSVTSDVTVEDDIMFYDDENNTYDGIVSLDENDVVHRQAHTASSDEIPKYLDVSLVPQDPLCNGDELFFEGKQFCFVDCDDDFDLMDLDLMESSSSIQFYPQQQPDVIVIDDDDL